WAEPERGLFPGCRQPHGPDVGGGAAWRTGRAAGAEGGGSSSPGVAPMKFHHDYSRVQEAIEDPETWRCIRWIQGEMREGRIIGADDAVLREAAELHPGADRGLVRAY